MVSFVGWNSNVEVVKMNGQTNPYARALKQPITMRLDKATIDYFKALAEELGMPYQSLINLYLRDCVSSHRKIDISWQSRA